MRILSIDPSWNSCGVVMKDEDFYIYFIIKPKPNKKDLQCPIITTIGYGVYKELNQKLIHFCQELQSLLKQLKPDRVIIEDVPFVSGSRSTVDLAILSGAIRSLCIQNNIPFDTVNNMTWKKVMLGNAGGDKELTVYHFKKLHPEFEPYTTKAINDLADAYFIANYQEYNP